MDLDGRVAIVTGGASGLGRFIADAFRAAGARVIVADLRPGEGMTFADVGTEAGRTAVLAEAHDAGGLDVLVNNAGGWTAGPAQFPDAAASAWRATIELNLLAPMELTQRALPELRRSKGAVVNVASSAGVESTAYGSPEYAAAKAGLIRFTTAAAGWRERYGVRVNCVVPGWIGLERAHAELAAMSPAQRSAAPPLIRPELIAAQVLRLACDKTLAGRVVTLLRGDEDAVLL